MVVVIAPGKSISSPWFPIDIFASFLHLPYFPFPFAPEDLFTAMFLRFSLRSHLERHPLSSSALQLDLSAPFSSFFLISRHSHLSLYFFMLISGFAARRRTLFTLLSPPATFASSTNLSQDSSKPQSQSRYRSATCSRIWSIFLHFPPTLRHFTILCYAAASKTLCRSKAQPFLSQANHRGSTSSSSSQQWWSTAPRPSRPVRMTSGSRNSGSGYLLSGFVPMFSLSSFCGHLEIGPTSSSQFA